MQFHVTLRALLFLLFKIVFELRVSVELIHSVVVVGEVTNVINCCIIYTGFFFWQKPSCKLITQRYNLQQQSNFKYIIYVRMFLSLLTSHLEKFLYAFHTFIAFLEVVKKYVVISSYNGLSQIFFVTCTQVSFIAQHAYNNTLHDSQLSRNIKLHLTVVLHNMKSTGFKMLCFCVRRG